MGIRLLNASRRTPSRREQQKEARRRDILEAGFEVFTAQGFSATRLDDVAARAGVGKGTIYLYFDSKEALFEEVVRVHLFPSRDAAEQQVREFRGSAAELLGAHLHYVYSQLADARIAPLVAMVIGEGTRFPRLTEFFFHELASRTQDTLRGIIEKGVASGEFRATDIVSFTQILVAPAVIGALWKLQFAALAPMDLDAYARAHVDLVLDGLRAQPPGSS